MVAVGGQYSIIYYNLYIMILNHVAALYIPSMPYWADVRLHSCTLCLAAIWAVLLLLKAATSHSQQRQMLPSFLLEEDVLLCLPLLVRWRCLIALSLTSFGTGVSVYWSHKKEVRSVTSLHSIPSSPGKELYFWMSCFIISFEDSWVWDMLFERQEAKYCPSSVECMYMYNYW